MSAAAAPHFPARPTAPLSDGAAVLLAQLRGHAPYLEAAKTHKRMAEITGLAERNIIDAALELIEHGYLIVARVSPPMGIYLIDPLKATDTELADARRYADDLDRRGLRVLHRAKALRRAIEQSEQARRQRGDGQLNLGLPPAPTRGRF